MLVLILVSLFSLLSAIKICGRWDESHSLLLLLLFLIPCLMCIGFAYGLHVVGALVSCGVLCEVGNSN